MAARRDLSQSDFLIFRPGRVSNFDVLVVFIYTNVPCIPHVLDMPHLNGVCSRLNKLDFFSYGARFGIFLVLFFFFVIVLGNGRHVVPH